MASLKEFEVLEKQISEFKEFIGKGLEKAEVMSNKT
jgi:hypothetical protein